MADDLMNNATFLAHLKMTVRAAVSEEFDSKLNDAVKSAVTESLDDLSARVLKIET